MPTIEKPQERRSALRRSSSIPGLPAVTTVAIALLVSVLIMTSMMLGAFGLYHWQPHYLQGRDILEATGFGNAVVHAAVDERGSNIETVQNIPAGDVIVPRHRIDILLDTLASLRRQRSFVPDLRFPVSEHSSGMNATTPFLTAGLAAYPADRLLQLAVAALSPDRAEQQQRTLLIDLVREAAIRNGVSPSAMSVEAERPSDSGIGTTTRLMAILSGSVTADMLHEAVARTVRGKDVITEKEAQSGQKTLIKVYFRNALCVELLCITTVPFGKPLSESTNTVTPGKSAAMPSPVGTIVAPEEEVLVPPQTEPISSKPADTGRRKSPPPWNAKVTQERTESPEPLPEPVTGPSPQSIAKSEPKTPLPPTEPDPLAESRVADASTRAIEPVPASAPQVIAPAPAPEPVASPVAEPVSPPAPETLPPPTPKTVVPLEAKSEVAETYVQPLPAIPAAEPEPPSEPAPADVPLPEQNPDPAALAKVETAPVLQPVAAPAESASLTPPEYQAPAPPAATEAPETPAPSQLPLETPQVSEALDVPSGQPAGGTAEAVQPPPVSPEMATKATVPESTADDSEILLARNVVPVETYPPAPQPERPAEEGETVKAYLGIVLDDGGYGGNELTRVMELDNRLTLAILPDTPFASETVQLAVAHGFEIMVHMPMQAGHGAKNRFPGELTVDMTKEQIQKRTRECLDQFPEAVGVNNHTGGLFTTYPEKMGWFLEVVKAEQMYFVDSVTVGSSCAYDKAVEAGIPAARRNLFLDHSNTLSDVRKRFNELVDMAKRYGSAVGIGHFRPNTVTVLTEKLPGLEAQGIELVPLSELVW